MPRRFAPAASSRKAFASFVVGMLALVAANPSLGAVRVALVQTSPEQSGDVVALVEAGLTAAGKVSLVERQQIDKVLQEQQLQAVLGADAVAGRVAMGKLLQADLLVFIQPQEKLQPILNVVISETHQGLRLVRQAVPRKDPQSDAAGLQQLIDAAVAKQTQQIRQIFAVPPLVSNDLGFESDHLKGAYAKVLEGALAENKGVLVVELDEARAVAREIAVAGGADVSRPLPLYVLGEYRTAGSPGSRTVKLTLKLMQGDKQIAGGTKEDLKLEQAPVFLQQVAQFFLSKSAIGLQPASDPKIEAAQLADRARLQMSLGSWPEALDLMEASLLVDSDQPELHLAAVEVLTNYTLQPDRYHDAPKAPLAHRPEGAERAAYYRRGLEHLEAYLRAAKLDRDNLHVATVISQFVASLDPWGYQMVYDRFMAGMPKAAGQMSPATLELLRVKFMNGSIAAAWPDYFTAREASTEMFYRVLDAKARDKFVDDALWFTPWFDEWGVGMPLPGGTVWYAGIDPDTWLQKRRELKAKFAYLPQGAEFGDLLKRADRPPLGVSRAVSGWKPPPAPARNPAPAVVGASSSGAAIQRLAAPSAAGSAPVSAGADDDVVFTKLPLRDDGTPDDSQSPTPPAGWMPAGKGIDFLWNRDGIFVMKDRGVLHWLDDRSPQRWGSLAALPVFDGRYVWYTRQWEYDPNLSLLVVDPQQEMVQAVATDLPACSELEVAVLGPGRAFVVGYFGRTMAATIELNPKGKPQVKIIHEFRTMGQAGALDWHDTELVFKPKRAFALSETAPNGAVKQAVLVWRENHGNANAYKPVVEEHPLIIDVDGGGIRPVEKPSPLAFGAEVLAHDGVCDLITRDSATRQLMLRRIGVSQVTEWPAGGERSGVPSLICFHGAVLYADDRSWRIGAGTDGPLQPLRATPPPGDHTSLATRFALSEHYGLLWLGKDGVFQVLPNRH